MTLAEAAKGRDNNLNFIRLLASILVVYMHAFTIATGNMGWDKINVLFRAKEQAGGLAVDIFFIISGFLIARSYDRTDDNAKYFKARFLRMWPGLFLSVVFVGCILGPRVTYLESAKEYFTNPGFFKFMRCGFFVCTYTELPGVWTDHFDTGANGSLWTITYEVVCYIMVVVFARLWRKHRWTTLAGAAILGTLHYVLQYLGNPGFIVSGYFIMMFCKLGSIFCAGMAYYSYQDKIKISWRWALVALAGMVVGTLFFPWLVTFDVFGSYIVMYLSFQKKLVANWYNKVGDLSYGVYIWSFPIQQEITSIFDGLVFPYTNLWLTLLIVIPLAWFSWTYIEKPALSLKDKKLFGIL